MNKRRRHLILAAGGLLAAASSPAISALLTPRQPAGPFYPDEPPLDDDNDLIHVAGEDTVALGQATNLQGRLLDNNGRPVRDTRIEIWQCDANGRYRHSRDPGRQPVDPGFQGFGHTLTDAEGRYRFLTIRPVPYPGRTPHIHVAVFPTGERPFVTQLYVANDVRNDYDFLYRRMPVEKRARVTAAFEPAKSDVAELAASWDIVIGTA